MEKQWCSKNDQCQDNLVCGSNTNCSPMVAYHCCYTPNNGDINFCQPDHICEENQGDCDSNLDCRGVLACGNANCPHTFGTNSTFDCCYKPINGDLNYCQEDHQCGQEEGDCDNDNECQNGLACGSSNCPWVRTFNSPDVQGFNTSIDCCYKPDVGDKDFCRINICAENQGHCDNDSECKSGLACEINKCQTSFGFNSTFKCCYKPVVGDDSFCRINKCAENEGYCSNDNECQKGFACGKNNGCYKPINGDEDFCRINYCTLNEGHCKDDNECFNELKCGRKNCPTILGFDSSTNCCYSRDNYIGNLTIGEDDFCTTMFPCGKDEGHCNTDNECQSGLICGKDSYINGTILSGESCPTGFNSTIKCCSNKCPVPRWMGDGYCDDENNNIECNWDGGDC